MRVLFYGVVQGVGFRPAVYRAAVKRGLKGYVRNLGSHVEVVLAGGKEEVQAFLSALNREVGPLVRIDRIVVEEGDYQGEGFTILPSGGSEEDTSFPPDVAVCDQCLEEIFDPGNRRYLYPFTNCTNCGARFTVIESLPYDRERTAMRDFPLCEECQKEYSDPLNRRFHAQTISCPRDGPEVYLLDGRGNRIEVADPIKEFARRLDGGEIGVIKGWGGMHVAALPEVSDEVRRRYSRPFKPLAVMVRDVREAERWAVVDDVGRKALLTPQRPIVLLPKREGAEKHDLSEKVAPGLPTVGLFLPYSALQHVLFYHLSSPALIMTSANLPGEPMVTKEEDALKLDADMFLFHRRRIVMRADDSLIIPREEGPLFIRRSRGYVPDPFPLRCRGSAIAVGPEMNATGAVAHGGKLYLTQYIGNLRRYTNLQYMKEALSHFMKITGAPPPEVVAMDMHPRYVSRRLGREFSEEFGADVVEVQHHHAHAASLALEWNLSTITALTLDGVGYGVDGRLWGGEVIALHGSEYRRLGSLEEIPLPGGDSAVKHPRRIVWGIAHLLGYTEYIPDTEEGEVVIKLTRRSPQSTSMGRFMDALSALLGVCYERTYDGEPAMRLESYLDPDIMLSSPLPPIKSVDGRDVVDTLQIFSELFESLPKKGSCENIEMVKKIHLASRAVGSALKGLLHIAIESGEGEVGLTGGVAYNRAVEKTLKIWLKEEKKELLTHRRFPAGDGGISAGQISVALKKLEGE